MKFVSIDIGIKNLSFCFFELTATKETTILAWNNLDLSDKHDYICMESDCEKPATLQKNNSCYCNKHAKKKPYLLPPKDLKQSHLNKQTIASLTAIATKYKVPTDGNGNNCKKNLKKVELLAAIQAFVNQSYFEEIVKTNASKVDLVTIGRNLQHKFDAIFATHFETIDAIIIENQIGPIANKMKTIQGMIAQYFIMKNNNVQIEFISACNKLKDFAKEDKAKAKTDYKQRKKMGIEVCLNRLQTVETLKPWHAFVLNHGKKDDLSDCFLQGLWYIKHKVHFLP